MRIPRFQPVVSWFLCPRRGCSLRPSSRLQGDGKHLPGARHVRTRRRSPQWLDYSLRVRRYSTINVKKFVTALCRNCSHIIETPTHRRHNCSLTVLFCFGRRPFDLPRLIQVSQRETGAPHRHPRAAPVPRGRAGVHSILPGGESPAASPRQPLHLRSPWDGQDGVPQLCAAGDEGTSAGGAAFGGNATDEIFI